MSTTTPVVAPVITPLRGTDLGETLTGTPNADIIYAYGGNDTVYGGTAADIVYLGTGSDTFALAAVTDTGALTTSTGAAFSTANGTVLSVLGLDVVYDFRSGDTISIPLTLNTPPVLSNGATIANGASYLLKGVYTAGVGFAVSSSGTDSMYAFDLDGAGAGTAVGGVILVGYDYVAPGGTPATGLTGLTGFGG